MKGQTIGFWFVLILAGVAGAALVPASNAVAGPAAIASCGKTISASGSYVVTRNLTAKKGGVACIEVNSGFVTIDLQGFTINCAGNGDGINAIGTTALLVRNGKITGCFNAIDASEVQEATIEGITATSNSSYGITVGKGALVKDCVTSGNQNDGINAVCPSNIIENTSVGNTGAAIGAGSGCNLSNNATD